ncbi:MAG: hypothetical protein PHC28_08090 [Flavobacterium sp.]|nr:hypothetical protein [Flavobacterium sp.]MDD5150431.1 hypothetical protein [Flavobacterium sp.]
MMENLYDSSDINQINKTLLEDIYNNLPNNIESDEDEDLGELDYE